MIITYKAQQVHPKWKVQSHRISASRQSMSEMEEISKPVFCFLTSRNNYSKENNYYNYESIPTKPFCTPIRLELGSGSKERKVL